MPNAPPQHPNVDVRMRGFAEWISVEAALTWLDSALDRLGMPASEVIALDAAAGRVLSEPIVSKVHVPNFQRAMMDGYALRAADIGQASAEKPKRLHILGDCFPGHAFAGIVQAGEAVRIMTGAPLPAGVDCVLPVEQTVATGEQVFAITNLPEGKNLGRVGEDIRRGETLLEMGRVLRPQDVGVLASIGHSKIKVVRRPRVQVIVTGDELLPAGAQPQGSQIVDANGPMLAALIERDGGLPQLPGIVPDDRETILAALKARAADVILTTGGSSVGQEDHVPTLLAEHGKLAVHGVAMRPAGPIGMGTLDQRLVVLLPGNPVACLWGYDLLAGRAIRHMGRRPTDWPYRRTTGSLARNLASPLGRLDYIRVELVKNQVKPVTNSGASVLSSTTRADGFVVIPSDMGGFAAGDEVEVYLYD